MPASLQKSRVARTALIARVIAQQEDKASCDTAAKGLATFEGAFWKRWVVLCQAKSGEQAKASLGLELLREQNQVPDGYLPIVSQLMTDKPLRAEDITLSHEGLAWLAFGSNTALLAKIKPSEMTPLAAAMLWHKDSKAAEKLRLSAPANVSLMLASAAIALSQGAAYVPDASYMTLDKTASAQQKRRAFLTYALYIAMGKVVPASTEVALAPQHYEQIAKMLSPAWQGLLLKVALAKQPVLVALHIIATLTQPLHFYAVDDIALAVKILRESGFEADAAALAKEAMLAIKPAKE